MEQVPIGSMYGQAQQEGGTDGNTTILQVVATGFSLVLNASEVNAGRTIFSVKNAGVIPHNFSIHGDGIEYNTTVLMPGESVSLTVDLLPGVYTYQCTVHLHYLLGMKGILTVADLAQS